MGGGATATTACALTVTHDPYDGFHIGVPDGWNLFMLNGTAVVSKDPTGTEEAVVAPALITTGLTPSELFTTSLDTLKAEIASFGGTMTYTLTSSGDQHPAATLSLHAKAASMVGEASLVVLPEATAHGSSQGALVASWAPPGQFSTDRAMLASIGVCYGPEPGTLYQVVKDQVFTYAIPVGWSVASEGQDAIDISDGHDAEASFALTAAPASAGVDSPQSLLTFDFHNRGITISQVLTSVQLPSTRAASGATPGQEYVEFTGTSKDGRAVHGLVHVLSVTSPGAFASGTIRLGLATTSEWNSVNGALAHVIGSIQHDFTQDLQQFESLNRQWQAFGQQVQGFDEALNGVDLVHDSATGATFEAPYAAYSATGPDGPGYYDKANNKLQIQTP